LSSDLTWFAASGRGAVYSFSINRRGDGPFRPASPFVLAYVELDEGPRVLTNIVGIDAESVEIGMRVRAIFVPAGDTAIVRFEPA
jgi:uncharacterized OB-fold protein